MSDRDEIYAPDEIIAFDGEDIRLVLGDRSSRDTLITFSVRPQVGKPLAGFAAKIARDNKWNSAYIIAKWPHWWQSPEMDEIADLVREANFRSIEENSLAYGASMGAFGAMSFAKKLNSQRALLLAPQVSVDHNIVPFEHRWDDDVSRINFLDSDSRNAISDQCDYMIFFDPRDKNDSYHASMIKDQNNIYKFKNPFGGHTIPELLLQTNIIKDLVKYSMEGVVSINHIRKKIRSNRHHSSHYFDMMSRYAIANKKPNIALEASKKWIALRPDSDDAFARAVKSCKELSDKDLLEKISFNHVSNNPGSISGWRNLRQIYYENGRFEDSYECSLRCVNMNRPSADDFRWCVRICLRLARKDEAIDWYSRGIDLHPDDISLMKVGLQAYQALGLTEQAATLEDRLK